MNPFISAVPAEGVLNAIGRKFYTVYPLSISLRERAGAIARMFASEAEGVVTDVTGRSILGIFSSDGQFTLAVVRCKTFHSFRTCFFLAHEWD